MRNFYVCGRPIGAVTLKDLVTELDDVTDWFHLGIHLEVSSATLRNIRNRHQRTGDIKDMKTDMLMGWMDNEVHPTWSPIVRALVGIKMAPLARKLGMKYGKA